MGQDVLLEQLENDQLDLDLDAEHLAGIEESRGQRTRSEGIALLVDLPADQGVQAGAQVGQRGGIAAHHPRHHRVHRDGLLQFLVLYQAEAIEGHGIQGRHGFAGLYLVERRELLEDLLQVETRSILLRLRRRSRMASKKAFCSRLLVARSAISKRGVVGVVEQRLQRLFQLQRRLVAHLHEDDRQAPAPAFGDGSEATLVRCTTLASFCIGTLLPPSRPRMEWQKSGTEDRLASSVTSISGVKTSIYIHYRDTFKSR